MDFRVGLGQDSHRINLKSQISNVKSKPLILGGVLVDEGINVEANSDGDMILHALFNACSTAIGGRSIGFYDAKLLKKSQGKSAYFCRFILQEIEKKGYKINNISIAVEAKIPKLEPYAPRMKKNLSRLFKTKPEAIGLTFTSGEGLTAFGKGEGIRVLALVSLVKK